MRKQIVLTVGLAVALLGAGAWAIDSQGAGNDNGAGTQLQAPANPNTPAPPDQAQPNQANPAPPNAPAPNPAPPNAAPANPAPPDQAPANPAPPNAAPANPAPPNTEQPAPPAAPAQTGTATTPVYASPLQELVSHQVDEIGELEQQLDQFRAANRPDAVMVAYHMIRDHRLLADAAANTLARRGDVATPMLTVSQTMPNAPADMIRQDIQERQQTATNLQQLISSANTPEDKNLYQRALDVTNKHLQWLQALDQGQKVAVGFFGPTTPLGQLSGPAAATTAIATGYPQPPIAQRVAGYQQQVTTPRRVAHHRRYRHRRSARYARTIRYR